MSKLADNVRSLLVKHLGDAGWKILSDRAIAMDQFVDVALGSELRLRFIEERGGLYYGIEVADQSGQTFYSGEKLALLAAEPVPPRPRVVASRTFQELEPVLQGLSSNRAKVAAMLLPNRVLQTKREMAAVAYETRSPFPPPPPRKR